jgi:hypothetical protein
MDADPDLGEGHIRGMRPLETQAEFDPCAWSVEGKKETVACRHDDTASMFRRNGAHEFRVRSNQPGCRDIANAPPQFHRAGKVGKNKREDP